MSNDTQQIVNKAWNYAHALRDDGLSYLAYTEQITFLLFLKMADELASPPWPPAHGARGVRLAVPQGAGRRRAAPALPTRPRRAGQSQRHALSCLKPVRGLQAKKQVVGDVARIVSNRWWGIDLGILKYKARISRLESRSLCGDCSCISARFEAFGEAVAGRACC